MSPVWISALGLCGSTLLGAALGFFFKNIPHKWSDTIMGFCAGVMLSAAILGLILPSAELCQGSKMWIVVVGVLVGALFLNLLDLLTPHLHSITGLEPEKHKGNASINKVMLFVLAIALHKLPEGIAAGVGFNAEDISNAWGVTIGISIQNVPEAMVIIAPLLLAGVSRTRTVIISLCIGLLEIVGIWIGYALGGISQMLLPAMLAFAGGSMLYVVSDEMIPETHSHGHQKAASFALLIGFLFMLLVEG